ncbi:MAG: hypothetical protein AAGM22_24090 [Acidobacteriota bacterium]
MSKDDIKNVEIDSLNDEELESVAGGLGEPSESCCCTTGDGTCSNSGGGSQLR